jgi:hypothetical protein
MKNSRLNEEIEKESAMMEWFDREKVVRAFAKMGFIRDYEARFVLVLRNSSFPFQRVVLPSQKTIHIELLKLYAQDLEFSFSNFIDML